MTRIFYRIKNFFSIFKTCRWPNTSRNFLAPAVKFMTCMAQTPSVCEDEIYKDLMRFSLMLTVAEK